MEIDEYRDKLKEAQAYLSTDPQRSLSITTKLKKSLPNLFGSYLIGAEAFLRINDLEGAKLILEEGVSKSNEGVLKNFLGAVYAQLGLFTKSVESFKASGIPPQKEYAIYQHARALIEVGDVENGILEYKRCLAGNPKNKGALIGLANLFMRFQRFDEAIKLYEKLIRNYPDLGIAYNNLAGAFEKIGRIEESVNFYKLAIEKQPDLAISYYNLALIYDQKYNDAEKGLETINLGFESGRGSFLKGLRFLQILYKDKLLDWTDYEKDQEDLNLLLNDYLEKDPVHELVPYMLSYSAIGGTMYRRIAERYAERLIVRTKPSESSVSFNHSIGKGKIKVGYLAPSFRIHPGGFLVRKLLEYHDSSLFEVHALSLNHTEDFVSKDIQESADYYHNVSGLNHIELAEYINRLGIDIIVALAAYNDSMRFDALALKPAPIQMILIGSHETTGASFIDYMFSDQYMLDEAIRSNFSENIISLPCSLMLNSELPIDSKIASSRKDYGLSEDSFVFASFNHPKKLDPETVISWMQILKGVPEAILWVYHGSSDTVKHNFIAFAAKHGVSKDRLVFASNVSVHEHWERYRHADLFLDSFVYNAHTTGIECLRLGKLILTKKGDTHNSRICSSLLHYSGLDELIINDIQSYIDLAIDLAKNPVKIIALEEKLSSNPSVVLFDSEIQVRYLEKAFRTVIKHHLSGKTTQDFIINSALRFDSF